MNVFVFILPFIYFPLGCAQYIDDMTIATLFTSRSCAACDQTIKTEWEHMISEHAENTTHRLYIIDCDLDRTLCTSQNITSLPWVKYRVDGEWISYTGNFNMRHLKAFVKELNPSCNPLTLDHCELDFVNDSDITQKIMLELKHFHVQMTKLSIRMKSSMRKYKHAQMVQAYRNKEL